MQANKEYLLEDQNHMQETVFGMASGIWPQACLFRVFICNLVNKLWSAFVKFTSWVGSLMQSKI